MTGMEKEITSAAEAMPEDKYNFAPTQGEFKGVRTFGQQVKHLAEANYEFFDGWNVGTAVDDASIEKLTSKADILKALADSFAYAHKAIDSITAANAFQSLGKDKGTRAGDAAFCLAHSMDHYGQIVVLSLIHIFELIVDRIKPPPEARFPAVYLPVTIHVEAA